MSESRLSLLVAAMTGRQLLRITTRFEDSPMCAYVLATGPEFALLAIINDGLWFDGFACIRTADVRGVEADPYASFVEAALRKRGQRRPRKPRLDLDSIERILLTANKAFPLVAIHLEKKAPGVCHIGRVQGIADGTLAFMEISPHAIWENQVSALRLSKITRVSFGGDYEDALHIVAGDSPLDLLT